MTMIPSRSCNRQLTSPLHYHHHNMTLASSSMTFAKCAPGLQMPKPLHLSCSNNTITVTASMTTTAIADSHPAIVLPDPACNNPQVHCIPLLDATITSPVKEFTLPMTTMTTTTIHNDDDPDPQPQLQSTAYPSLALPPPRYDTGQLLDDICKMCTGFVMP